MDNSFLIRLGLNADEIAHGLHKATDSITDFKEQIIDLGKSLLTAFALERVAEFAFEISELAAKAHGVKEAFNQLPESVALLDQMREITHDTVSDLDLMGKAIHAENLNIPLKDLGTLLEFTHIKAIETNRDFNSLADTLLKAIGKGGAGAKKAMAELWVSTDDWNKALKETGGAAEAAMKIAEDAIAKTKTNGLDPTLEAIESSSAAWENLKVTLGEVLNKSEALSEDLNIAARSMKTIATENLSAWEKLQFFFLGPLQRSQLIIHEAERKFEEQQKSLNKVWQEGVDIVAKRLPKLGTIKDYQDQIKDLTEKELDASGWELSTLNLQIQALQTKVKLLKEQGLPDKPTPETQGQFALKMSTLGPDTTVLDQITAKNDELSKSFQHLTEVTDEWADRATTDFKWVHQSHEMIAKDYEKMQENEMITSKLGRDLANDLAGAFSSIADGSQTFSQAMGHMVQQFGKQMLAMALAGIIAKATTPGSSGGNVYAALAAAAIGVSVIGAMFSKIGVGGAGSSVGSAGGGSNIGSRSLDTYQAQTQTINVTGDFKLQGSDMVAWVKTANRNANVMGGN